MACRKEEWLWGTWASEKYITTEDLQSKERRREQAEERLDVTLFLVLAVDQMAQGWKVVRDLKSMRPSKDKSVYAPRRK